MFFGILTTLINMAAFWYFNDISGMDYRTATTASWAVSVLFAFLTNKLYVFDSKSMEIGTVLKEFLSFVFFRLLSYFLDIASMMVYVEFFEIHTLIAKMMANILVIVFNYYASKVMVFRKTGK
jgi:putative flippase GtrA